MWRKVVTNRREYYRLCASENTGSWKLLPGKLREASRRIFDEVNAVADRKSDLAGPGIGSYDELERILLQHYTPLLNPKEAQQALAAVENCLEENLSKELIPMRVEAPLIAGVESGVNDYLDRDDSRAPAGFHISNEHDKHPVATRWKRVTLKQFGREVGEGFCTHMGVQ